MQTDKLKGKISQLWTTKVVFKFIQFMHQSKFRPQRCASFYGGRDRRSRHAASMVCLRS